MLSDELADGFSLLVPATLFQTIVVGHTHWKAQGKSGRPKVIYSFYDNPAGRDAIELIQNESPNLGIDLLDLQPVRRSGAGGSCDNGGHGHGHNPEQGQESRLPLYPLLWSHAGAGLIGELAAELDAEQRAERQARAEGTVLSGSGWRRRRRRWSSCVGWRIR